jgi:hypothetical protein
MGMDGSCPHRATGAIVADTSAKAGRMHKNHFDAVARSLSGPQALIPGHGQAHGLGLTQHPTGRLPCRLATIVINWLAATAWVALRSFKFWRDCWVRLQSRRLDDPLRQVTTTLIRPAEFPALPEIWTSTSFPSAIRYLTRRSTE